LKAVASGQKKFGADSKPNIHSFDTGRGGFKTAPAFFSGSICLPDELIMVLVAHASRRGGAGSIKKLTTGY
jgi:hypothetical protein